MLKTLTDWINWTNTTTSEEWNTWEEWQRQQSASHFEKSDIFQYYLSRRPYFQPPQYSCVNERNNKIFIYCFGDFSALLVNPQGGGNAIEYFMALLDLYDICKGVSRRLTGDPSGIMMLREIVSKRNLEPLQRYDFNQHMYPYHTIHAHTVAQYSLSTLLMRLVAHYMSYTGMRGYYSSISISICQKAYEGSIFGSPIIPKGSTSINIIQQKPKNTELRGFSWPRDQATCSRCKACNRVTEHAWGSFNSCLDCHLKRICSICGTQAVIISTDGFPKCGFHQDHQSVSEEK